MGSLETSANATTPLGSAADSLADLGVTLTPAGGRLRVWSGHADTIELVLFDDDDPNWITETLPLAPVGGGVFEVSTPLLRVGSRYAVRVGGPLSPRNTFNDRRMLLEPYSRGLVPAGGDDWRSVVVDNEFDWAGVGKPGISLDRTVLYEAHLKGLSKRHPGVPEALRGTYAGLGHPAMLDELRTLGVTSVELLPVHAFVSEQRLIKQGLSNYWGYNTLNFFTPHAAYATKGAQASGPSEVLREFKGMVKGMHEAGIEVILDVVYNHTAEEGIGGPRTSLRGIDNASYYRQTEDGAYIDTTGCGNTINTATDAAARMILDSLRFWAREVQVDGFRFDLAAALGRDAAHTFDPQHPLLQAIMNDPQLADTKRIAEPWDVGMGGWQTGNFADGWQEWNDRYRDRVRNFWLSDIDYARRASAAPVGIGGFATRLAGSSNTFSAERGPLASVNFVAAHDGFTVHDLVSYDVKHNIGNGEQGRDGADTNRSFNHGTEGPTSDPGVLAVRRKAIRNLMGTLLLSSGIPMVTAGDEFGRTQRGNNNAYCHDSALTWLDWQLDDWQLALQAHTRKLIELRAQNPALRPSEFARLGEHTPNASVMDWFDAGGNTMSADDWNDPRNRTLQYVAASTPDTEAFNRILLIVHGTETPTTVVLPTIEGVTKFVSLWDSAHEIPDEDGETFAPGAVVQLGGTTMWLFRAE